MTLFDRLVMWWRELTEAWRDLLDVWDSDFPDGSDYPIPEGFDLRAMPRSVRATIHAGGAGVSLVRLVL